MVQYFHLHDHETVERVLDGLGDIPVANLRTAISWCDWMTEGGEDWYGWLLATLTERFDVLPCFLYTPPELGILPKTSSPPRDPRAYGEFVEMVLRRHEGDFSHVELWNEPNNYIEWDWTIDPEWVIFAEMIGGAAQRAAALGVKSVLGGMSPFDPNWLDLMFKRGALEHVDVIGVHGFPGTWEAVWEGWDAHVDRVQEVLDRHASAARVWITESGFSTWAHDEFRQLATLVDLAEAPAERVYWYSVQDLAPERETLDGFHADERAYHFGLQRASGSPKLLGRVLADGGLGAVRETVELARTPAPARIPGSQVTLVTGGAGFIGTNLVHRLAAEGRPLTVLDNLSAPGSVANLRGLKQAYGDLVRVEVGDVRDAFAVRRCLAEADGVIHLAALPEGADAEPDDLLDVNLRGTVNVLEEARRLAQPPPIVFASSSEVYEPSGDATPVDEAHQLGFSTPFGCSKGAADQYVLGYARSFGLATCALRIGAVYGPHQGNELGVRGEGDEVHDLLHVDDLIDALLLALSSEEVCRGRAFNIGGGQRSAVSANELAGLIEELQGRRPRLHRAAPAGGPRHYVSDFSRFAALTGWEPKVELREGLARLLSETATAALPT